MIVASTSGIQGMKAGLAMAMTSHKFDAVIPANHIPGPRQGEWTYNHYIALPDDEHHYEIVDGVLYMSPAPNLWHQEIVAALISYLRPLINNTGLGRVFVAPTDVVLSSETVVQPDVAILLKAQFHKMGGMRIGGAPDLVIEVASPKTATYDRHEKYDSYLRAGVAEYWIVDPNACTIEVRILKDDTYQLLGIFEKQDALQSVVVPMVKTIRAEQIFAMQG